MGKDYQAHRPIHKCNDFDINWVPPHLYFWAKLINEL